jgi:hypothetical protein
MMPFRVDKNMKKINYISIILATFTPLVTFAATGKKLSDIIGQIVGYLNLALQLMMGLAVVLFVWNVINYYIKPGSTDRAEAGQYVMWSLIGFFIILSLWGLVNILISTFDLGTGSPSSWTGLNNLFPR